MVNKPKFRPTLGDLFLCHIRYMSNEKRAPGWLDYIGDEILPSYIGILSNHYKDPY